MRKNQGQMSGRIVEERIDELKEKGVKKDLGTSLPFYLGNLFLKGNFTRISS